MYTSAYVYNQVFCQFREGSNKEPRVYIEIGLFNSAGHLLVIWPLIEEEEKLKKITKIYNRCVTLLPPSISTLEY